LTITLAVIELPTTNFLWPGHICIRQCSSGHEKLFHGFLHAKRYGNTALTNKVVPVQVLPIWGKGDIAPLVLNLSTREVSGQLHTLATLTLGKEPQ